MCQDMLGCTRSTRGAGVDSQALGVVGDIQDDRQRRARGDYIPVYQSGYKHTV